MEFIGKEGWNMVLIRWILEYYFKEGFIIEKY